MRNVSDLYHRTLESPQFIKNKLKTYVVPDLRTSRVLNLHISCLVSSCNPNVS